MDYENKLKDLKDNLDKATNLKYKAEAKLEQLNNQEKDLIEELKVLGVRPEDLEDKIEELKEDIEKLFNEADKLLPKDILD